MLFVKKTNNEVVIVNDKVGRERVTGNRESYDKSRYGRI
jgi:hypothetical protein